MIDLRKWVCGLIGLLIMVGLITGEDKPFTVKIKQLTPLDNIDEGSPTWSPDGKKIAYTRYENYLGNYTKHLGKEKKWLYLGSIWVSDTDSSNQKQVSPIQKWEGNNNVIWGGISYDNPWWSPDGTHLLIRVEDKAFKEKGRANGDDYGYGVEYMVLLNIKTQEIKEIEHKIVAHKEAIWKDKGHEIEIVDTIAVRLNKTWDELTRISIKEEVTTNTNKAYFFIKEREDKTDKDNPRVIKDLYLRKGKDEEVLLAQNFSGELIWSPDKKRVAFITDYDVEDKQALYIMNADGNNLTKVSDMPKEWSEPDWSPDGTKMLFEGKDKDEWNIYQVIIEDKSEKEK